jgi:hypothetical protein
MASLDGLKITECPLAFASLAAKHNALVDMLATMRGQNGITVVMAEKNAIIRSNVAASGGGGGSLGNLAFASVVTSDGRLQNVLSNSNVSNSYPTTLKVVTVNGNVTIDSAGVSILTSGGKLCNIAFASIARDISIRTISVCDTATGTTKSMDIIASAAY